MRSRKAWARASRLSSGSRVPRGLPKGRQASGIAALSVIGVPFLKRLILGVREAFGGLLRLGGVMIPGRGFWMFLEGFRAGGFRALFSSKVGIAG